MALVVFPLLALVSRLPWFLLLALAFLLLFAAIWYGRIRSIVFDDAIRVRRVRGRERVFAYHDVRAITHRAIRMRRGAISLMDPFGNGTFENAAEVVALCRVLLDQGIIPSDDLIPDEVIAAEQKRVLRSLVPAAVVTVAITAFLVVTSRMPGNDILAQVLPMVILLALFLVFYLAQHPRS